MANLASLLLKSLGLLTLARVEENRSLKGVPSSIAMESSCQAGEGGVFSRSYLAALLKLFMDFVLSLDLKELGVLLILIGVGEFRAIAPNSDKDGVDREGVPSYATPRPRETDEGKVLILTNNIRYQPNGIKLVACPRK